MRTPKEISAQIATLKKIKPLVPAKSVVGDDNHGAIEAQIEVLKTNMSEDDIFTRADDGITPSHKLWTDYVRDIAMDARQWLDGNSFSPPSTDWEPIIKK